MGLIRFAIYVVVIYWAIRFFMQLKGGRTSHGFQGDQQQRKNREDDFTDYEEVN